MGRVDAGREVDDPALAVRMRDDGGNRLALRGVLGLNGREYPSSGPGLHAHDWPLECDGRVADAAVSSGPIRGTMLWSCVEVEDVLALLPVIRRERAAKFSSRSFPAVGRGGDALPLDAEDVRERGVLPRRAELVEQGGIEARDQPAAPLHEPADRRDLPIVEARGVRQDQHLVRSPGRRGSGSSR